MRSFKSVSSVPTRQELESLWMGKDGVWHLSSFVRGFLRDAKRLYPKAISRGSAPWPNDAESIGQNLTYLFPGHLMKVSMVNCRLLGDEESIRHLETVKEVTVLDIACGPGMGSIATVDFLIQLMKKGLLKRETPLRISFVLNDLKPSCVRAAVVHLKQIRNQLNEGGIPLRIASLSPFPGSILEVLSHLRKLQSTTFDILCFSNAFDHVLIYGEEALKENPKCTDPIAKARPCDRPALLADFFLDLGKFANPVFSRVLFLQEWRHSPLMPIALPNRELKVVRTRMLQEVIRPDVEEDQMSVRFCYCGCTYGYPKGRYSGNPSLLNLPAFHDLTRFFSDYDSSSFPMDESSTPQFQEMD